MGRVLPPEGTGSRIARWAESLEGYSEQAYLQVRYTSQSQVQFPKGIHEPRARYLVTELREASRGDFYRAYGDIRRLR